ncbi:M24 family metallopeptidase [Tepidiforma flava]|uniref:M24 family metallopeptidase n=1 Tax=Tepidiforma flava TaxID=3004094 RepID=A0ABY7M744_9CHLR|nr:M24 family metallopeptidase [Tepidiforma flava]WBL36339.1 M24 family metallopeptidase [Tepidiforma flava]
MLLVTRDAAVLAVDSRYWEQAEVETAGRGVAALRAQGPRSGWLRELIAEAGAAGKRVGVAPRDLTYAGFLALQAAVSEMPAGDRPELAPAAGLVEQLRRVKDAEELALLEEAIRISDRAFERLARELAPGMTELEAADRFERYVREEGGSGVSFPSIVAGGPWSALPHAQPRAERFAAGAPIVIDVGARYRGYCSDLTRTVVLGEPDAWFREVYEVVRAAQLAAIEGWNRGCGLPTRTNWRTPSSARRATVRRSGTGWATAWGLRFMKTRISGRHRTMFSKREWCLPLNPASTCPAGAGCASKTSSCSRMARRAS